MTTDVDVAVVGGGAVGMAIARALALAHRDVLVIERHSRVGMETSSHNSEVIHAGLYYRPGSLKARLCVAGKSLLYRFAEDSAVDVRHTGKLVLAVGEDETSSLGTLAETARRNGVADIRLLAREDVRALEPELVCTAALHSPSTGVIDSAGYLAALESQVASLGGMIAVNSNVTNLAVEPDGGFRLTTDSGGETSLLTCRHLVIAAGLEASKLGRMFPERHGYRVPATVIGKGHYFALPKRAPLRHLIYPMPTPQALGIHVTIDIAGMPKLGPDISWPESASYSFENEGDRRRQAFIAAVQRYWPGLPADDLVPGYTGLRPKLSREGEPAADFAIHDERMHGIAGLVALYGIESPGLTASLAIAEVVSDALA